jgi:hypothetical protein
MKQILQPELDEGVQVCLFVCVCMCMCMCMCVCVCMRACVCGCITRLYGGVEMAKHSRRLAAHPEGGPPRTARLPISTRYGGLHTARQWVSYPCTALKSVHPLDPHADWYAVHTIAVHSTRRPS